MVVIKGDPLKRALSHWQSKARCERNARGPGAKATDVSIGLRQVKIRVGDARANGAVSTLSELTMRRFLIGSNKAHGNSEL